MRIRRRSAIVLASVAAFGVGLIAYPASSAAAPPVVPTCTFPATSGSDSCATARFNALDGSLGGVSENVSLGFRWRSQFDPQTSETARVELRFDDDIDLDLSGVPTCPASDLGPGISLADAWRLCGPGGSNNAYLSMGLGDNVSGIVSSIPPTDAVHCVMIFKGADNTHLTIFGVTLFSSTQNCENPSTNTAGSGCICGFLFTAPLTHQPVSYASDWTLTIPNFNAVNPPVDDFYATLRRSSRFQARCPAVPSLRMVGFWNYTAAGDLPDSYLATDPCP